MVKKYFLECKGSAEQQILEYLSFFEECKKFIQGHLERGVFVRNHGTKQEEVILDDCPELKEHLQSSFNGWNEKQHNVASQFATIHTNTSDVKEPKRKRQKKDRADSKSTKHDLFAALAAELHVEFFVKMCTGWRDIAVIMREEVFGEDEEHLIDIYDVKCKEWGLLLKKLFGIHLGSGDYGHLTISHSSTLFREFRSFYHYSGQGFESSHKLHRQLYSRATNHDASGPGQSIGNILWHWYSTHLLGLRYLFYNAEKCIRSASPLISQLDTRYFYFRGCGWKSKDKVMFRDEDKQWIMLISNMFCKIFGDDFLKYYYNPKKGTKVDDECKSRLIVYCHETWEIGYQEYYKEACASQPGSSIPTTPATSSLSSTLPQNSFSTPPNSSIPPVFPATPPSSLSSSLPQNSFSTPPNSSIPPVFPATPPSSLSSSLPQNSFSTPPNSSISSLFPKAKTQPKPLLDMISARMTRWEMASTVNWLPKICFGIPSITVLYNTFLAINPCLLSERLCETVIDDVESCLSRERMNHKNPSGVRITGFGNVDTDGLSMLKKFCVMAKIKQKVLVEDKWLSQRKECSYEEKAAIKEAMWQTVTNTPILQLNGKSIDPLNSCELVEEKYLDNFIIDICIEKFLEDAYEQGIQNTLYLPTEFFFWMSSNDSSYIKAQLQRLVKRGRPSLSERSL